MKPFLLKICVFGLVMTVIISIGLFLPTTPRASKSLLFSKLRKDSMLAGVDAPRIVLVGGSNLSLGLNCKMICDSLHMHPINTGIHAGIGLIYMLDNTLQYVKPGDLVIVAAEYDQFFGELAYGREELLRTILDVNYKELPRLRKEQLINIMKYAPRYAFSKLTYSEYLPEGESEVYGVHSFNEFGDAYKHWTMKKLDFPNDQLISSPYNPKIMKDLGDFCKEAEIKGARIYITFPCYQFTSFAINETRIRKVEAEMKKLNYKFLGTPDRYRMPDSMMFNSTSHLLKSGVDYRTRLLVEDIRSIL